MYLTFNYTQYNRILKAHDNMNKIKEAKQNTQPRSYQLELIL